MEGCMDEWMDDWLI